MNIDPRIALQLARTHQDELRRDRSRRSIRTAAAGAWTRLVAFARSPAPVRDRELRPSQLPAPRAR